eukprot:CCRYP_017364-RA/>CCRYP_017364-RA protein AED:0.48 eAED:0.43 QI:0/0/0/1/0/0/2/0/170
MTFAQCWCCPNSAQQHKASPVNTKESMTLVFANQTKKTHIYPLMTREIAEAQQQEQSLQNKGHSTQSVENAKVICKDGKMVIPKSLQHHVVAWFHHYLQHPGTKRLEETLCLWVYDPIACQQVSQLPCEQALTIKIRETANKTCNHQPMGGILCGPHRTIHPQGQGQDTN